VRLEGLGKLKNPMTSSGHSEGVPLEFGGEEVEKEARKN
jgi:hypothetical protein